MYEYAPWAADTLRRIKVNSLNSLPILDLQLGGDCNLNCIYCDTERKGRHCQLDLSVIESIINTGNIQWVYVCGLGEPTAGKNAEVFKQILAMCKKSSVKVSLFSNMVAFDKELFDYIDCGTLHVLFKLDSFIPETMNFLYGNNKSEIMLSNYEKLKELVHVSNGTTNLGASIVPTSKNNDEICRIIDWCMKNNIYPLLGELEKAGKGAEVFEKLKLTPKRLSVFKYYFIKHYRIQYKIPICPATIYGIHITNTNQVIVDERTGLSCGWFWLDEPKMIQVGDITKMSLEEITSGIIAYRRKRFPEVVSLEKELKFNLFGGCGGDTKMLLREYISSAKYY